MNYILILYFSKTECVKNLAQQIARGINSTQHIEARLRTVPSVFPEIETAKLPIPEIGAPYATLEDIQHCSGLALGSPGYFGNMASPLQYFFEKTSYLWMRGCLVNKPACVFTSTSSIHGGQESVLLTMILPLLHHGMHIIGIPYTEKALNTTLTGGTPYGASHFAGEQNQTILLNEEKKLAFALGNRIAKTALQLKS